MAIKAIYSQAQSVETAVADIKRQAGEFQPKGIVFFAAPSYDPGRLSDAMHTAFSGSVCVGCTTAGEIVSGKMLSNSLVAMLFDEDTVEDMAVELVESVSEEDLIPAALESLGAHFGCSVSTMDVDQYVGIILIDGMTGAEEKIMDSLGNLTDLTVIGGSAGDDLAFKETFVFANGKAASNAAVLAVLKLKNGFDVIKTQSFCSTEKTLTATRVNESERRVQEFNGKPALSAYAEALACSEAAAAEKFMTNPVGLMVGDEPYIRSPQRVEESDMIFYCNIKEGMSLDIMQSTQIVEDTRQAVSQKLEELGSVSGIIDFHCILRTLELRQKNLCSQYGEIFSNIPTVGFSTYGEEYIGHINQTSTMLVFK